MWTMIFFFFWEFEKEKKIIWVFFLRNDGLLSQSLFILDPTYIETWSGDLNVEFEKENDESFFFYIRNDDESINIKSINQNPLAHPIKQQFSRLIFIEWILYSSKKSNF